MPDEIDDILAQMGMDRKTVRVWAKRSCLDGCPAACHRDPPRKEHPDFVLANGDVVKVTKYTETPEVGAIVVERFKNDNCDVYKILMIDDSTETFVRRDGLMLMCRADDIESVDFASFGFITREQSREKYAEVRRQKQIKIDFAIEMEKLLCLEAN